MLRAIEPATDQVIDAEDASSWHAYRCPRCHAPVLLRAGHIRTRHFAHASGLADPDCEEYFGGFAIPVGRRLRSYVVETGGHNTARIGSLYFDMHVDGPTLGLWIPATDDLPSWDGYIEVTAARTNRRLTYHLVMRGTFVQFPLLDGQWSLRAAGDVATAYLSRVILGPAALDNEFNVFDAERSPGRMVGPSAPIRLGQSVWLIFRNLGIAERCPDAIRMTSFGTFGGWAVYRAELPANADAHRLRAIQQWLRREVRPPLAKVWIASPYPQSVTPWGAQVFSKKDGQMEVVADQPVDLSAYCDADDTSVALGANTTQVIWDPPRVGTWQIRANGRTFLTIVLEPEPREPEGALAVVIKGRHFTDAHQAQQYIKELAAGNHRSAHTSVRWSSERMSEIVRVVGKTISKSPTHVELNLAPGFTVSVQNLGSISWVQQQTKPILDEVSADVVATARWLLSVALSDISGPIRFSTALSGSGPLVTQLLSKSWTVKYAAHVAALAQRIKGLS